MLLWWYPYLGWQFVSLKFTQMWSCSICEDGLTCEKKHHPQKRQDAYHEKKARATIIFVVHSLNYEKRCSKCTSSNVRHHIQLCTCVSEFVICTLFFPITSPPIVLVRWAQNNKEYHVYLEENIDSIHKNDKYWTTLLFRISFPKFSCYVQSVHELMSKPIHNKIWDIPQQRWWLLLWEVENVVTGFLILRWTLMVLIAQYKIIDMWLNWENRSNIASTKPFSCCLNCAEFDITRWQSPGGDDYSPLRKNGGGKR
jgi:hypothetical protein